MSLWRSKRGGPSLLRLRDWLIVALVTIGGPFLLGALFMAWIVPINYDWPQLLEAPLAFITLQFFAPLLSVIAMVPAIGIAMAAMHFGIARWPFAVLLPALLLFAIALIVSFIAGAARDVLEWGVVLALSGALHGAVMWLAIRLLRPEAVAPAAVFKAGRDQFK